MGTPFSYSSGCVGPDVDLDVVPDGFPICDDPSFTRPTFCSCMPTIAMPDLPDPLMCPCIPDMPTNQSSCTHVFDDHCACQMTYMYEQPPWTFPLVEGPEESGGWFVHCEADESSYEPMLDIRIRNVGSDCCNPEFEVDYDLEIPCLPFTLTPAGTIYYDRNYRAEPSMILKARKGCDCDYIIQIKIILPDPAISSGSSGDSSGSPRPSASSQDPITCPEGCELHGDPATNPFNCLDAFHNLTCSQQCKDGWESCEDTYGCWWDVDKALFVVKCCCRTASPSPHPTEACDATEGCAIYGNEEHAATCALLLEKLKCETMCKAASKEECNYTCAWDEGTQDYKGQCCCKPTTKESTNCDATPGECYTTCGETGKLEHGATCIEAQNKLDCDAECLTKVKCGYRCHWDSVDYVAQCCCCEPSTRPSADCAASCEARGQTKTSVLDCETAYSTLDCAAECVFGYEECEDDYWCRWNDGDRNYGARCCCRAVAPKETHDCDTTPTGCAVPDGADVKRHAEHCADAAILLTCSVECKALGKFDCGHWCRWSESYQMYEAKCCCCDHDSHECDSVEGCVTAGLNTGMATTDCAEALVDLEEYGATCAEVCEELDKDDCGYKCWYEAGLYKARCCCNPKVVVKTCKYTADYAFDCESEGQKHWAKTADAKSCVLEAECAPGWGPLTYEEHVAGSIVFTWCQDACAGPGDCNATIDYDTPAGVLEGSYPPNCSSPSSASPTPDNCDTFGTHCFTGGTTAVFGNSSDCEAGKANYCENVECAAAGPWEYCGALPCYPYLGFWHATCCCRAMTTCAEGGAGCVATGAMVGLNGLTESECYAHDICVATCPEDTVICGAVGTCVEIPGGWGGNFQCCCLPIG